MLAELELPANRGIGLHPQLGMRLSKSDRLHHLKELGHIPSSNFFRASGPSWHSGFMVTIMRR